MDINIPDRADTAMDQLAPISRQIWDAKYRLKEVDGTPVDLTIEDSWRRVARTLAAVEEQPGLWESKFFRALQDFRFLPAGRILSGSGSGRRVTLFNCFVMGNIEDDLGRIVHHLSEAALTRLRQAGAAKLRFVCLLAAPEGLQVLHREHPDGPVVTAAIDRQLDEHGYIRPGLGDAGDRLYGTK